MTSKVLAACKKGSHELEWHRKAISSVKDLTLKLLDGSVDIVECGRDLDRIKHEVESPYMNRKTSAPTREQESSKASVTRAPFSTTTEREEKLMDDLEKGQANGAVAVKMNVEDLSDDDESEDGGSGSDSDLSL